MKLNGNNPFWIASVQGAYALTQSGLADAIIGGFDFKKQAVFTTIEEAQKESNKLELIRQFNCYLDRMNCDQVELALATICGRPDLMEIRED